jgi:hydrogenase accessory protein HypB
VWSALFRIDQERLVLLSVTEGEDKPLKYPTIFNSADVAIITKSDLAAAVDFDEVTTRRNIQAVHPGMEIFKLSSKTGDGITTFLEFLERRRAHTTVATASDWDDAMPSSGLVGRGEESPHEYFIV